MGADQKFDWAAGMASLVDWWRDAGVDGSIAEEPRNWLAAPVDVVVDTSSVPPRPREIPAATANPVMALPTTIEQFDAWRRSDAAPDAAWPGLRVFARGPINAALAVVIEMPERDDGEAGVLLSGLINSLFERMLAAIGQSRDSILLVPMSPVRPTTGRFPAELTPALGAALRRQISLSAPKKLLIFGNAASRALLGMDITDARGALRPFNPDNGKPVPAIQAVASYHPRLLLERPAAKAEAWKDLMMLIRELDA